MKKALMVLGTGGGVALFTIIGAVTSLGVWKGLLIGVGVVIVAHLVARASR